MKRRTLLKSGLILAGTFIIPVLPKIEIPKRAVTAERTATILKDFMIEFGTGNIRYIGNGKRTYTVCQLYRGIQEIMDDVEYITEETPIMRYTDQMFEFINGFTMEDECAKHLKGGAIYQMKEDTLEWWVSGIDLDWSVKRD